MKSEYQLLIDYVTITGEFSDWEDMFSVIGLSGCSIFKNHLVSSGDRHYEFCKSFTIDKSCAITMCLGNNFSEKRGKIELKGKGCRFFDEYSELDWFQLFKKINNREDLRCTRLDIAYDVKSSDFPVSRFHNAYRKKHFITNASTSCHYSVDDGGGFTLYVGKRSSNMQLCIYDKKSERGYKTADLDYDWIRLELRFRRDYSNQFIRDLLQGHYELSELYFGCLRNYIRFIKRCSDSNKSRWSNSDWWDKLTLHKSIIKLSKPGLKYDINKREENIYRQNGSALMFWLELHPGASIVDFIRECKDRGLHLNDSQAAELEMIRKGEYFIDETEPYIYDDDFDLIYDLDLSDEFVDSC